MYPIVAYIILNYRIIRHKDSLFFEKTNESTAFYFNIYDYYIVDNNPMRKQTHFVTMDKSILTDQIFQQGNNSTRTKETH